MSKHIFNLAVLTCALLLAGCSSPGLPVQGASDKPVSSRLGDTIDVSLAELLTKPRVRLAELADECATNIQIQEKGRREGRLPYTLIPTLRLPLAVPVFRDAQYSTQVGFSLPTAETGKDSALAVHLARHGDLEAARKLVEPGDAEALQQIEACRFEREYPVEWTRLVGLLLHAAQIRLATGDVQGGTELVVLHRKLRAVLDPKAATGALGAVLLPRGREVLAQAAAAWRADKKTELAAQADAILADWGEAPELTLPFPLGTPRARLKRVLRSIDRGRVLPALSTARALDLLALPFPDKGAEAVLAYFDNADQLSDVLITYRTGFSEHFPEPGQLAHLVEERPIAGEDGPKATGLRSRTYRIGNLACAVTTVTDGAGVGGFVHLGRDKDSKKTVSLSRDFGAANLDRTFEQNRVRLVPEQRGETMLTIRSKALAPLRNPVSALKLTQADLRRETGHNLAAALTLRYSADGGEATTLHQLALPLWATCGVGQFQGVADKSGGHLALVWEDERTRYTLRLPYDSVQPVEFEAYDRRGPERWAEREAGAAAFDRAERKERLTLGKPLIRIPRNLEQVELGMSRTQVLQVLPPGQSALKRDLPGGLTVTFRGEPAPTGSHCVRQMFLRFDHAGRVIDLRARYMDGPAADAGIGWMAELLNKIKKRAGAPGEGPSPWLRLWTDLPPQKPAPVLYRWQDDTTVLTYQRDGAGVELALRDCPIDFESAIPLPPVEYLPRGLVNCRLGIDREELLHKWGVTKPITTEGGALVLRPPENSSFDALLVWFEKDHAVRIVARHAQTGASLANPAQWAQALTNAWGRDFATLGWPRRQDMIQKDVLQSLGWHDDRTQVRIFWQEAETGPPRVFTEWRELATP